MRKILILAVLGTLAACGPKVSGDIGKACIKADRKAANPALCSCVQRVANQTLSSSDQRRAASFFADPQEAQDARTADGRSANAFWDRYKAFSQSAERSCR